MSTLIDFTISINGKEHNEVWKLFAGSENNENITEFINCLFENFEMYKFRDEKVELVKINSIIEDK